MYVVKSMHWYRMELCVLLLAVFAKRTLQQLQHTYKIPLLLFYIFCPLLLASAHLWIPNLAERRQRWRRWPTTSAIAQCGPTKWRWKKKIKLEMMNCVIAIEWHDDEEWWLCDGMANVEWQTKWLDYRSEQIRATCTVSIHETNSFHSVYPCDFDAMTEERWDKYVALTIYSVVELEAILLFPPHIFLINLSVGCVCVSSVFTPSLSLFLSSMAADNYHCNQLNIRYYYLLNAVWITHFFAFLFVPGKRPNHILWSEQIAMMMMANTNTEFYLSDTEVRLNTDA